MGTIPVFLLSFLAATVAGIPMPDGESLATDQSNPQINRTVADVVDIRRKLQSSAANLISKSLVHDLSTFKSGPEGLSVSIKSSAASSVQLILDDSVVQHSQLDDVSVFQRVRHANEALAIIATPTSDVWLTRLNVSATAASVTLTSLASLRPASANVTSVSTGLVVGSVLFYSTASPAPGGYRVQLDALNLADMRNLNIKNWVDISSGRPLMHFFTVAGRVYFVLEDKLYVYKDGLFDRLNHEMLDTRYATSITGFNQDNE
ncbi:uncharacterized protein LOC108683248 [Hyalella azteca]|uniref:Uncharacterized protein LOC108683248 n=1 Tax=Hyalella azteca TaxID=294128 RepID=A0A8B7PPA5_HYAAZ|nr:uncharacterized protein LOC108683248 [Hyalella azteca]